MLKSLCAAAVLLVAGCAAVNPDPFPPEDRTPEIQRHLELLTSFYPGTYDTIEQPKGEGDNDPVKLRIARVWPDRKGEYWYYEEYAKTSSLDKPYLQRLVRAGEQKGQMMTAEYELPEPAKVAGGWRNPAVAFAGINPATLQEYPGCRQLMSMQHMTLFNGGTIGTECHAHVPPGAHLISDFFLSSSSRRLWDRGYDKAGNVVWGSASGALETRRMSQVPQ